MLVLSTDGFNPSIYPVTSHTRHVGSGSTFVAIDGFRQNGVHFIEQAIARGATKIVLQGPALPQGPALRPGVSFCFVDDCRKALAQLSSEALGNPASRLTIVGITGTKGKTSTTFLVEHMLRHAGYKTALLGSIKNKILDCEIDSTLTTPESDYLHMFFDQCVRRGVTHVVMEISSHSIALQRVHGIFFDAIGFTNLAPEHMDFHPTMEHYFKTKSQLFSQRKMDGVIIVNSDDAWGRRVSNLSNVITFGQSTGGCNPQEKTCPDHRFSITQNRLDGLQIVVDNTTIEVPSLFGEFNAYNVVMACLLCSKLDVDDYAAGAQGSAFKTFPGIPGRLQMHRLTNGARAFVDFAHNPSSFEAVLQTLRPLTSHLIIVFGCGGDRDKTKRPVMGRLAAAYGDEIIVTNDNPRNEDPEGIILDICQGIPRQERTVTNCITDRKEAIARAVASSRKETIIALLGKGHESYYLCRGKKYRCNDFEEIVKY